MPSALEFSPLPHLIALTLLGWLWRGLRRAAVAPRLRRARAITGAALLAWLVASSWIAARGWYLAHNADLLLILLGTAVPVLIAGAVLVIPSGRELLLRFIGETPPAAFARIHALRILAIGTLYGWWIGDLPGHFEIPVGIPDFLIGLTAPLMARCVGRDPVRFRRAFAVWNLLGAAVLLQAPLWIQLSQPGPLHVFSDGPTTAAVLSFPLAVVPTFVAPLFVCVHAAALAQLRFRKAGTSSR